MTIGKTAYPALDASPLLAGRAVMFPTGQVMGAGSPVRIESLPLVVLIINVFFSYELMLILLHASDIESISMDVQMQPLGICI